MKTRLVGDKPGELVGTPQRFVEPARRYALRCAHLVATVGRDSGGLGPYTVGLAAGQQALGASPSIWCIEEEALRPVGRSEFDRRPVEIVGFPRWGPPQLGLSPAMEAAARQQLGGALALLHQHSLWLGTSHVTMRWRRAWRRPTVIAPQGTLLAYSLSRSAWKKTLAGLLFERRNLRAASCLHAASEAEAQSFRKYGLSNPIAVMPNAVPDTWLSSTGDAARFRQKYRLPANARLLLFISRVHPLKGLPLLFEALQRVQAGFSNWLLVVAGPDQAGHTAELIQSAARLGISQSIRFIGAVFDADKRDAFAAAEMVVLPTLGDSFAIVVAEALGVGVPVVTTRGAPWEELQTHHCGWWTDISAAAIGDALGEATQRSAGELEAMGQRGRQLVAARYTWSIAAERTLRLYEWLLGKAPRPEFVALD